MEDCWSQLRCFSWLYFMIYEQISSRYWRKLNTDGYALLKYVKYWKTTGTSVLLQNHQTDHQVWHPSSTPNIDAAYGCFSIKVISLVITKCSEAQLMIAHSSVTASIQIASNLFRILDFPKQFNTSTFWDLPNFSVFLVCYCPFYGVSLCLWSLVMCFKGA